MGERTHGSVGSDARAEAVTRLYEREAGTVRRLVGRRARVPVDVLEDACQTAWERLWSHAEVSLQRDAAIRWLVVTASRHAWREYRNRLRVGARAVDGDAAVDIDHAADPLEIALDREQMQALIGRLGTLTVRERRFLAMHAAGMSYREIGAQTGSTLRTVERQILRGRRKLIHQTEHRGRVVRGWIVSRDGSNNHEGLSQPRHCAGRIDGPAVGRRFLGSRAVRLQPITLRGRLVACATASRYFLADELLDRPVGDPDRTFVMFMCAYARDVLCGALPGPYTDADARRYARAALVPEELVDIERRGQLGRNLDRAAHALGVPIGELELMLAEASSAAREGGS